MDIGSPWTGLLQAGAVAGALYAVGRVVARIVQLIASEVEERAKSAAAVERLEELATQVYMITGAQLSNNGGGSLLDKIDALVEAQKGHSERLSGIESSFTTYAREHGYEHQRIATLLAALSRGEGPHG